MWRKVRFKCKEYLRSVLRFGFVLYCAFVGKLMCLTLFGRVG